MKLRRSPRRVLLCGFGLVALACGAPAPGSDPQLLIVGLDGADLRWVDALSSAGRTPRLAELLERGVSASLETIHRKSPIIWTSVATGVRPARHGIGDFLDFRRPVHSTLRRRPAFWNVLSHYGRSVGVLAWWATYPAERVRGYMVSPYLVFRPPRTPGGPRQRLDWSEADPRRTWPPGLAGAIAPGMLEAGDIDREAFSALLGDALRTRVTPWVVARDLSYAKAAHDLLETHPVETVAVYFQGIDVASHDLERWVFGEKARNQKRRPRVEPAEVEAAFERIRAMYAFSDRLVGDLLDRVSADTDVVVLSDHGWEYDGTGHRNNNPGVFLAAGPSFRSGRIDGVSVLDIAPIVLASRGVPVSRAFDGRIPPGVLDDALVAGVEYVEDYPIPPVDVPRVPEDAPGADLEEARLLELLEELGYVE